MKTISIAAAISVFIALPTLAQEATGHSGHSMPAQNIADNASIKAFMDASKKMHADMKQDYTGNTDVDFVRGMIPHHQGAIDMAKVELQYGKDPEIRKLAEEVIRAQEAEIAMMKEWLKSRGH